MLDVVAKELSYLSSLSLALSNISLFPTDIAVFCFDQLVKVKTPNTFKQLPCNRKLLIYALSSL